MSREGIVGWDLGGAHLKAAVFDGHGTLIDMRQIATPLWRGLDCLTDAISEVAFSYPLRHYDHVMTMTGELVDWFEDRRQGVSELARRAGLLFPKGRLRLYAGPQGFIPPEAAERHFALVASANWYASAALLAGRLPFGLLVDVGSTTSDLLRFGSGGVSNRGYSDRERLAYGELVYSGVVRTPVMAVVQSVPFGGEWQTLANEHFATMADVYRVLGWLPDGVDLYPSADGRDKSATGSMRRLARMLGADLSDADAEAWRSLAGFIADRQIDALALAAYRLSSLGLPDDAPIVSAGSGAFLVERLAQRLGRACIGAESLLGGVTQGGRKSAECAPAAAIALLALEGAVVCAS